MNKRERFLLFTLLGLVIVAGGWALFYFVYQKPMATVNAGIAAANAENTRLNGEMDLNNNQIANIYKRNPHLKNAPKLSLPELKLPPGKAKTNDEIARHNIQVEAEYGTYLRDLVRSSGFTPTSINVAPKGQPDSKSSPQIAGKGPVYTKISFTVACSGNLGSIIKFTRAFYTENLLQEVHTMTITKPGTIRQGVQPDALEVQMTVEALLVSGAEARPELKPKIEDKFQVSVLANDHRDYDQILTKNMFLGKGPSTATTTMREDPNQVLGVTKLTTVSYNERRGFWEAALYDQGKPPRMDDAGNPVYETKLRLDPRLDAFSSFSVHDMYDNLLLTAKVVLIQDHLIVIDVKGKYYQLQTGDFLYPAIEKPLSNVDIKLLGLTPPVEKAEAPKPPDEKSGSDKIKAPKEPMPAPE